MFRYLMDVIVYVFRAAVKWKLVAGWQKWRTASTALVIALAVSAQAQAVIRRVDHNSPGNGPGTASDWSDAYLTLTGAINASGSGDVIHVADGVYTPTNQSSSFEWEEGVTILGGFTGYTLSGNPDARNLDPATNGCVLSGDINGNDGANFSNYSDNCYHVITGTDLSNSAVLESFTIRGGNASAGGLDDNGGGMFLTGSRPSIRYCRVIENRADGEGGGAFFKFSGTGPDIALIRDCIWSNNHADSLGGGMYLSPPANITTTIFENNNSGAQGGAIWDGVSSGVVNVFNCEFRENTAPSGAAIAASGSSFGTLRVANSLMALNEASVVGGAIQMGGELHLVVANSTIADNDADDDGGGIYLGSSTSASSITNSIVWGNTSASGDDEIEQNGATLTVTYSDIGGGSVWTGTGNINGDPDFVGGGDYTLVCGSPCINSGDDETIAQDLVDLDEDSVTTGETLPVDLAFVDRILGADASPDTDWVDMGAYEKTFEPCLADTNSDGNVDIDDLLNVLNNWGSCSAPCPYDVAPGGPCGVSADGQVNIDDLLAVNNSWGDCAESFGGGGGGGSETSQAVLDCMADAEAQELTGEAYIAFMWECLCAKGVFDCD